MGFTFICGMLREVEFSLRHHKHLTRQPSQSFVQVFIFIESSRTRKKKVLKAFSDHMNEKIIHFIREI